MPTAIEPNAIYRPAVAAVLVDQDRAKVDGACRTGALRAIDATPDSRRRHWKIRGQHLLDWFEAGMPAAPTDAA